MGSQATQPLINNDRSRTYWTPAMERYFIDLMIDQLRKGNRVGHTFNKQAWTDMLRLFNAKFRSQYDKDVLKGRYTNLWKQFSDVKNLLCQSCFSWDETQQMVIADDASWDAYFRAHPEATVSYRTKPLLYFNDLCCIFGYTTADGRYSRSSHDVDFDDGDGLVGQVPSTTDRPRTDWNPTMDQYFIELMLDQLGRGNKSGDTFNKQSWSDMLASFNAKFGPQHGKRVLRHRYKKLWKYYTDATILLKQDGFSWDGTRQMITADDSVWDAYVKVNPHARSYRNKPLPNYDDLALIYGHPCNDGTWGLNQDKGPEYQNLEIKTGEQKQKTTMTNDRTRTYWTPPMDRYLVDLLLDQVLKGNKLGQTFITQAWTEMITSFNANFRSNHEKDVLKNRYKHFRKQFNDIKSLLKLDGFSWDDEREMVTAQDPTWDAYIKEHPDARSFRVKTVPSFHKLCVIFGEDTLDGRYSRLALNMEPNVELPVLMTGEEENAQYSISIESPKIEWTEQMDNYFIGLMLEVMHDRIENRIDQVSDGSAWNKMVVPFSEKFGPQYDKYALQDRYLFLMKQHAEISNLLSRSGFAWDGAQQMVTADNRVWEAYIKEYPGAIAYRGKYLGYYIELCKVSSIGIADGSFNGQLLEMQAAYVPLEVEENEAPRDNENPSAEVQGTHQERKRPSSSSDATECTVNKIQRTERGNRMCAQSIVDFTPKLVGPREQKRYTAEGAISALQAISDMDDDLLLDACDLLEDERKAKTFLALDGPLRKKWLLRKLRPQLRSTDGSLLS